jgi:hypothetical protein
MVIGDANVVQVLNLELEPDWNREFEAFIDEAAWVREVARAFELETDTKAKRAELMARAREVTVLQYATKVEDAAFMDYGMLGASSRLHVPVWTYVQELVFRSYRIPRDYAFGGVPLSSLRVAPKILCGTEISGTGLSANQRYRRTFEAFYPDARMEVVVRGQPLDLVDGRSIQLFSARRITNLRDQWVPYQDFEFDDATMAVRFRSPIFLDGDPAQDKALYSLVNKGKGGGVDVTAAVPENSSYLDVVVPNPAYQIEPAGVKVSLAWELGKYRKVRGSGNRRGKLKVPGLSMHLLDVSQDSGYSSSAVATVTGNPAFLPASGGVEMKEIKLESGLTAGDTADAASDGVIQLQPVEDDGSFERFGQGGMGLSNTIDRVTIEIGDQGLKETVEFTKARPSASFMAERLVARIQRAGELFPGQAALKRQIDSYRLEAKLQAGMTSTRSPTHKKMGDVNSVPIGAEIQSTVQHVDELSAAPEGGWKAGHVVWLDDQGRPSTAGTVFGGVLVSEPSEAGSGEEKVVLNCATAGTVPVICEAGTVDQVWCDKGSSFGRQDGTYFLGELRHADAVPDVPEAVGPVVRAMVALGFGGGVAEELCGFQQIRTGASAGEGSESSGGDWQIVGGTVVAGPRAWGVDPHEILTTVDGRFRYFLRVRVTINSNAGVAWPGIESSEEPEWERVTASAGYPESFLPTNVEKTGDVIIPLMLLEIEDGVPRIIQREGVCSPIVLDHCLGKLIFFGTPRLIGSSVIIDDESTSA